MKIEIDGKTIAPYAVFIKMTAYPFIAMIFCGLMISFAQLFSGATVSQDGRFWSILGAGFLGLMGSLMELIGLLES